MLVSHANSPLNSNPPAPRAERLEQPLNQPQSPLNQATQSTQATQIAPSAANVSLHLQQDTVTISATALRLSATSTSTNDISSDENAPVTKPELPNDGDKANAYIEYRKAKMQYQIYSDMASIVTGNSNNVSPVTAHYLSNNDQARAATVDAKAQQQQIATMQTYAATTSELNDQD
ncbi:hypothetical protein [Shewanella pneumatophori]|uniref:Uncharacterized protein n=1 Tax=Shewanella pneumatophori TaxID=314092 RepID=A0A9X1ZDF6_9GAMM|nr:hypothetical protein [Shewanella pneumatophori]MCL1140214.1 hypothetical protein [Shewanella pneumatophori]